MIEEERFVCLDVATDDAQQEIGLAHERVALEDLRVLAHRLLELEQRIASVPGELDVREDEHVEPDFLPIEERHPLADHLDLLEPAHPSPAGRGRHAEALGDLRGREITMLLNEIENPRITAVEVRLHCSSRLESLRCN